MEALHRLLLRLVHFEFSNRNLVLIAFTARKHLISEVDVGAASREALLEEDLVVTHLELVAREACLVVLEILFLAHVGLALAFAVVAVRNAFRVT